MLHIILVAIAVIVVLFLIIVALQPSDFRVSRSAKLAAPPEKIFPQVNELRNWEAWSPWAKLDPNCKITYSGPPAGMDAGYAWAGNKKVGEGRLTITESKPSQFVRLRLEFLKPFKATNTAEFMFRPEGNQTVVTWNMFGNNNFIFKAFALFMNCDKMIGGDFEKGLTAMKTIAEADEKT
jgi:Polyketide cyclase / dehydrase and lipid transport